MRILLIKPKHIGDSLILTPTIEAIKRTYPDSEIWVVVRRGCEGILAGCTAIARLLTIAGVEKTDRRFDDIFHQAAVAWQLLLVHFDYVFELGDGHRARFFAQICRTSRRFSVKPASPLSSLEKRRFTAVSSFDWERCHRIEKDFYSVSEFLPLPEPIPSLCFARELTQTWAPCAGLADFCVLGVGKRQLVTRWLPEAWRTVGEELLKRIAHLVIVTGADREEVELANWLREQLGPRVLCTRGEANWAQVAGLLYRARLYVGLDTAGMHLAAACHCPVVALFGPSIEDHWHPWQVPYRIVTIPDYLPVEDTVERHMRIKQRLMCDIRPSDVVAACDALLAETKSASP